MVAFGGLERSAFSRIGAPVLCGWEERVCGCVLSVHANNSLLSFISTDREINNVSRAIPRRKYSIRQRTRGRQRLFRSKIPRGSRLSRSPRTRSRFSRSTRPIIASFSNISNMSSYRSIDIVRSSSKNNQLCYSPS